MNEKQEKQKVKLTFTFGYFLVGLMMMLVGALFILFGGLTMAVSGIVLEYVGLPETDITLDNLKDLAAKQSIELRHSQGLSFVGIGIAIVLASIPILFEFAKQIREHKKTKEFLISDLETINNRIVKVIKNFQNTKKDLETNKISVKKLAGKNMDPNEAFSIFTAGAYFHLWHSYANNLRDFDKEEQKTINQLKEFIDLFNREVEPDENKTVSEIYHSIDTENSEEKIFKILSSHVRIHLSKYEALCQLIHSELNKITWIPNDTWKKIDDIPNYLQNDETTHL